MHVLLESRRKWNRDANDFVMCQLIVAKCCTLLERIVFFMPRIESLLLSQVKTQEIMENELSNTAQRALE